MFERSSGVLMHIASLPGKFGIGSFGQAAYDFVDFLVTAGQSYWQILPLTTTSYGDSPYSSFSAFAGNSYFIDLDLLAQEGYLDSSDYAGINFGQDPNRIDYGLQFNERPAILKVAVKNFLDRGDLADYQAFLADNRSWLSPYAEFMALKEHFGLKAWYDWEDEGARMRYPDSMDHYHQLLAEEINYHYVVQYFFRKQWQQLKQYANDKHIQIIGDIPIYVALDSVEVWSKPEYFKLDDQKNPIVVSGTPPDAFTAEGQYWGNPIYDWNYMESEGYAWWINRVRENLDLYDVLRIDHFRGFESYWEVPYGAPTAAEGYWVQGPGIKLFDAIKAELGSIPIIAEDLGFITMSVKTMLKATGFPGLRVMQFGFYLEDSQDLPHNYVANSVAYVGTHDNQTARGWYEEQSPEVQQQVDTYLHRHPDEAPSAAMNRGIASSVSNLAIYTMQDLLDLDDQARMNAPGSIGENWQWRATSDMLNEDLAQDLYQLSHNYFRLNPKIAK